MRSFFGKWRLANGKQIWQKVLHCLKFVVYLLVKLISECFVRQQLFAW